MHNIGTVIRFEIVRTLKKKSFWITALAIPTVIGFVGAIIFFSNQATEEAAQNLTKEQFSIGVTDKSNLISKATLESVNAQTFSTLSEGNEAVKSGSIDAYIYYPEDISNTPVQVYGKDVGLFENSRYQEFARQMLQQSVTATTAPEVRTILQGNVQYTATTYAANGQIDRGLEKLIAPGIFLILFYLMMTLFANQILMSVTEEKENRVIEMILTTVKPTTLIIGKLFSLIALALIQIIVILIPILIGYFALGDQLTLPNFDLSQIPLDPIRIIIGAVVFMVSFIMFAGLLMTLGAAMPTAKEASGFFGGIMALIFGPLYAAPLFISSPDSVIVQVLSYFPLTSPIPLLLRNAVGNLTTVEAVIGVSILVITSIVIVRIGVRVFRFGALEYSRRLSLSEIFGRST